MRPTTASAFVIAACFARVPLATAQGEYPSGSEPNFAAYTKWIKGADKCPDTVTELACLNASNLQSKASRGKGEMGMTKEHCRRRRALPLSALPMVLASAVIFTIWMTPPNGATTPAENLAYAQSRSQPRVEPPPESESATPPSNLPDSLKDKQRNDLRKFRFNKMKEHSDELAKLAKSLQEDLDKSNENILSLEVVGKAQKIEKLAKKIQEEARFGT